MEQAVLDVLAEYEARARLELAEMGRVPLSELEARIDEFLLPIGPDVGRLMYQIVCGAKAQVIVEIGASYGYSTVWLAAAARRTGGKVHSLELAQHKVEYGSARLKRVGLQESVEHHVGDARETLAALAGPFDFVLLDLWKDLYIPCFELFQPKLAAGAFVVADNMLEPSFSRPQADAYRARVRESGKFDSLLLPIGSGIELSKRLP
jgi:predicted O-methyltransferase YrrM